MSAGETVERTEQETTPIAYSINQNNYLIYLVFLFI